VQALIRDGLDISELITSRDAILIVTFLLVIFALAAVSNILKINIADLSFKILKFAARLFGRVIFKKESKYHRDLTIGKINDKTRRVKTYRFLNNLIIDLGLKQKGATPYEFLLLCLMGSGVISVLFAQIVFANMWMSIVMYPIFFAVVMCVLYTKANMAHDQRIENVIEAENIICNNIKDGVVVSIKNSVEVIHIDIRGEFKTFIDNIEFKNYHVVTALMELNQQLGSIADDFIKKCIVFETEEEHGVVGMFKDVVEVNNIKTEMRIEMKRKFEQVVTEFIISSTMIFVFLGGVIAFYPAVANFYINTMLGQLILAVDALIMVSEFVYITYLKAVEV